LIPNWEELGAPLETKAGKDRFLYLSSESNHFEVPSMLLPPQLHNDGNYIISLSKLVRWLATQAEELGVEVSHNTLMFIFMTYNQHSFILFHSLTR